MKKYCILSIIFLFTIIYSKGEIVINEIMQSNVNCIMDDMNEYPDSWVELYNPSNNIVSLEGYALGDKEKPNKAYHFPSNLEILPYGHLIIYCDKAEQGRHASFRLESGKGCNVYLFKNEEVIDKIEDLKKMPAPDISYGRRIDGSEDWGYQLIPSPGTNNFGGITDKILGDPIFTINGRILTSAITLDITLPEDAPEGTIIRFTTDGSEPSQKSDIWDKPLDISDNLVIRAKLYKNGYLSPLSTTNSYIFHDRKMNIPIISITGDNNDFYSDKKGIFSDHVDEKGMKNYQYDWRRPINFEFFMSEDQPAELNQICETRVKGQSSRNRLLKSMIIYANKRFGAKRLEYEFFPEQRKDITDFKSIELRNSGNDYTYTYMKDMVIQSVMGENSDIDWSAGRTCVVYFNGKYHGLLNLRERTNEDNIYTNYDGLEDLDLVENWKYLQEGSDKEIVRFTEFYNEDGHSFEEYSEMMDIPEFFNIIIMNMYYDNFDFPGNNLVMWRPQGEAGKWRWIAKDCDAGLGLYWHEGGKNVALIPEAPILDWYFDSDSRPEYVGNITDSSVKLFIQLMKFPEAKKIFIDRFLVYMGDFLTPEMTSQKIDYYKKMMEDEYPRHYEKNISPEGIDRYESEINTMKQWIDMRHEFMPEYLCHYFNLGEPGLIEIISQIPEVDLAVNNIRLTNNSFHGLYPSDYNMNIESLAKQEGINYIWEIAEYLGEDLINTQVKTGISLDYILSNPDYRSVITVKETAEGGIKDLQFTEDSDNELIDFNQPFEIYSLQGVKIKNISLETLSPGIYILKQKYKSIKYQKN